MQELTVVFPWQHSEVLELTVTCGSKIQRNVLLHFQANLYFSIAELYGSQQYTHNTLLHWQGNNGYVIWGIEVLSPVCS